MDQSGQESTNQKKDFQAPSSDEHPVSVENKEFNKKSQLCMKYRRGVCTLSPKECQYAHGIKDLQFQKLDLANFKSTAINNEEKEQVEEEPSENEKQSSKKDESSYILIYQYQFELQKRIPDLKIFTQEELDNDINCLRDIRWRYRAQLAQDFMDLLYETYGQKYLPKEFVKKCIESIGWEARWVYIFSNFYAVEREIPGKGAVILKMPQGQELDEKMMSAIIRIVKEEKLLENLPINPSTITSFFYKRTMIEDPYFPNFKFFLAAKNLKKIDEYLKQLENNKAFMEELATKCGVDIQSITGIPIFDEKSPDYIKLLAKIEELLVKALKCSVIGFYLFSEFEKNILVECNKLIHAVGKAHHHVRQMIQEIAFKKKVILIDLLSDYYLVSLDTLLKSDIKMITGEFNSEIDKSCLENQIKNFEIGESHHFKLPPKEITIVDFTERMTEEQLNQQIDIKKILLVNSFDKLNEAKNIIANIKSMGIDLEGILSHGGLIELIQCACNDRIVIFDLFEVKCHAKNKEASSDESKLHNEIMAFIKRFMEDEKICKVFHDCRRDSLALHLFVNCCPNNIFDVSSLYMLVQDILIYRNYGALFGFKNKEESKTDENEAKSLTPSIVKEILHKLEKSGPPGLNDVFEKYKAEHGKNNLKDIMKERFDKMPKDYFYQRPIDQEYLIYSAKDVEDLVDVKDKMLKIIWEFLKLVDENIAFEKAVILAKKVSKTYASWGCLHAKNDSTKEPHKEIQ